MPRISRSDKCIYGTERRVQLEGVPVALDSANQVIYESLKRSVDALVTQKPDSSVLLRAIDTWVPH